jgi:uncharacterized integral membrane protein (TIGR00698 family)
VTKHIPGVIAALVVMLAGFWLADRLGLAILAAQGLSGSSPVSGVPVAIVLGLLLRNVLPLPAALSPGLKFATTTLLRAGIVFVGIRLSLFDVLKLGLAGLPVVLAAIATGMVFVTWFNRRLGLPPRLGTLVAAGTSICGVTAIVSTAPAIEADEREVAYAVANVVAFGLFGMLVYPYLAHAFLTRSESIGLFLGTAVHDTSQVVGAALTYKQLYADDVVLRTATVTKLTRNIFLAVVIPVLTWLHVRENQRASDDGAEAASVRMGDCTVAGSERRDLSPVGVRGARSAPSTPSWMRYVPGFVLGFLAMAVVRSAGDAMLGRSGMAYGLFDAHDWKAVTDLVGDALASRVLLGTAMAAVGLSTSFTVFRGVGLKPFAVGFAGALVVGSVGMLMAVLFGRFVAL